MNTEERPTSSARRDSGEFRIISMERIGPHTYRITTESKRYGRVTQEVVVFPESVLGANRPVQEEYLVGQ